MDKSKTNYCEKLFKLINISFFSFCEIDYMYTDEEKSMVFNQAKKEETALDIYILGYCYYYGLGTKKDLEKAVYYLNKSAELGFIDAQFELAGLYLRENVVENNFEF